MVPWMVYVYVCTFWWILILFLFFFFLAVPVAYGSSWARDKMGAQVVTYDTATAMLDP